MSKFREDLEAAREAEYLVLELLRGATDAFTFDYVGDNRAYFHKGDIVATDNATGDVFYLEVKDDSRIGDTHNILCEERVEYYNYDLSVRGNIYNAFDIYIVVSKQQREIYILDGKVLKTNYKKGIKKYIQHKEQATDAYLLPLDVMREAGGLIATIGYDLESRRAWVAA